MSDIRAIDTQKSIIRFYPTIQGSDGIVKNFNNKNSRFRTTTTDPDSEMFPSLSLERHREQLLVVGQVARRRSPVLLDPLPVDAEPQHGGHLAESSANLNKASFFLSKKTLNLFILKTKEYVISVEQPKEIRRTADDESKYS